MGDSSTTSHHISSLVKNSPGISHNGYGNKKRKASKSPSPRRGRAEMNQVAIQRIPYQLRQGLRPIIIDGNNVACFHGRHRFYSCRGIQIAVDHFRNRGHEKVTALVPQSRLQKRHGKMKILNQEVLTKLYDENCLVFTPSRWIHSKLINCYDDRFVVELATRTGGVILSNDYYRDLEEENEEFKRTIYERLLMFCFADDILLIPHDPLGREGPTLERFLTFPD